MENETLEAGNAGQETEAAESEELSQEETEQEESQENETDEAPETAEDANAGETDAEKAERERQAKIDFAFQKKQRELREERQLREQEARRRQELEQKLAQYEQSRRPDIPPMPDPYDDEYDLKVQQREDQIRRQVEWDQQQRYQQQIAQQQAQERENAKRKRVNDAVETFQRRTKALGLSEKQMIESEQTIAQFITPQSAELVEHILTDDDGPLVVQFLANNPFELDKLAGMTVARASAYIESRIKPNARKLKPAITRTPKPITVLDGKGGENVNPYIRGATFE